MIRKLYALVAGDCAPDNPDSSQHQEILLGGFLYLQILKERLDDYLNGIKTQIQSDLRAEAQKLPRAKPVDFRDKRTIAQSIQRLHFDLGQKMTYFLATGNLHSVSGLDLQQVTGYTIVAEKLNFLRYLSHFRAVHRGSFFTTLRTTTVRKLLPESWGFICPVHTPDGSPCGLLNHLSHTCKITTKGPDVSFLPDLIMSLGVSPASNIPTANQVSCVQLDGRIIGWCTDPLAKHVAQVLRLWKVNGQYNIPRDLEIGYVPLSNGGQYPGLYIFSTQARMTRPVKHIATDKEDWVGPFEQVYMSIAIKPNDIRTDSTHVEIDPTNILSIVANLTPFSDFNPSPRNMYQCQMGKQTMGTPGTAISYRTDNKMYRLQTGQTPVVRTRLHTEYGMDHFPNGTNAIVAVISYTGYDMDDAVILNKSSVERGFAHGSIFKTEVVDLKAKRKLGEKNVLYHFGFGPSVQPGLVDRLKDKIDDDGLPFLGTLLREGDPLVVYWDDITERTMIESYHGPEDAFVDEVRILGMSISRKC
jgi:DNA-directed RNA polymerase I subunit RPA2